MWFYPNISDKNHGLLKTRVIKGLTVLHLQGIVHDLNCMRVFFHKRYTESIKLLGFWKIFQDEYFKNLGF